MTKISGLAAVLLVTLAATAKGAAIPNDSMNEAVAPSQASADLTKRFQPDCEGALAVASEAVACINHLTSLGSKPCTVPHGNGGETIFCSSGHTQIRGHNVGGASSVSSSCVDVARAAGSIMDRCTIFEPPEGNLVSGHQAAFGNGDLVVIIENVGGL